MLKLGQGIRYDQILISFASLPALTKQVVVASGYFDPLHYGHIEYLEISRDRMRPKIKSLSSCLFLSLSLSVRVFQVGSGLRNSSFMLQN